VVSIAAFQNHSFSAIFYITFKKTLFFEHAWGHPVISDFQLCNSYLLNLKRNQYNSSLRKTLILYRLTLITLKIDMFIVSYFFKNLSQNVMSKFYSIFKRIKNE
jgi:hypothetical protein